MHKFLKKEKVLFKSDQVPPIFKMQQRLSKDFQMLQLPMRTTNNGFMTKTCVCASYLVSLRGLHLLNMLDSVYTEYHIYPAIRQGFRASRMTSAYNNLISPMKFCYNTNFTLHKQFQRSRSILQDGSRSLKLFWKEKFLSYNRRDRYWATHS